MDLPWAAHMDERTLRKFLIASARTVPRLRQDDAGNSSRRRAIIASAGVAWGSVSTNSPS